MIDEDDDEHAEFPFAVVCELVWCRYTMFPRQSSQDARIARMKQVREAERIHAKRLVMQSKKNVEKSIEEQLEDMKQRFDREKVVGLAQLKEQLAVKQQLLGKAHDQAQTIREEQQLQAQDQLHEFQQASERQKHRFESALRDIVNANREKERRPREKLRQQAAMRERDRQQAQAWAERTKEYNLHLYGSETAPEKGKPVTSSKYKLQYPDWNTTHFHQLVHVHKHQAAVGETTAMDRAEDAAARTEQEQDLYNHHLRDAHHRTQKRVNKFIGEKRQKEEAERMKNMLQDWDRADRAARWDAVTQQQRQLRDRPLHRQLSQPELVDKFERIFDQVDTVNRGGPHSSDDVEEEEDEDDVDDVEEENQFEYEDLYPVRDSAALSQFSRNSAHLSQLSQYSLSESYASSQMSDQLIVDA